MTFTSLLNNITLLISLSVIHAVLLRFISQESKRFSFLSGLLFSAVAVAAMINSVELMPGVIFDGRSIVLVTAGAFGGPVPGLIAISISTFYRIYLGGAGTLMGILVILESGLLGILFYYLKKKYKWTSTITSYGLLALIVHITMLLLLLALPVGSISELFSEIFVPVLIIYPLATVLLFIIFHSQDQHRVLVEKLSASEAELQEANRIAVMGRWEYDIGNEKLYWSDTIYEIFEIDKNVFNPSYDAFLAAIHPDDRDMVNKAYEVSLEKKVPYEIEHRLLLKDGRIKWLLEKSRTDYDDNGLPIRSIGIVQDITLRKLAENKLKESEKMLRLIIDTIPVRVFWKDTLCRYLGCNKAFAIDAGFDNPDQLTGLDDYQMGWVDQADLYRFDDLEVMRSGKEKLNYDEPQTTPGGGSLWLRTSKLPLRDMKGVIIGVLGTYEDITHRKQMENDLIVAKDKAEESDRLKTAFLNNLSHEIRTPLNAIVGFSELLRKPDITNEELDHFTGIIHQSSSQLLGIIDDIFDIAAIEARQVKIFEKEANINKIVRLVFDHFLSGAAKKNLELNFEVGLSDKDSVILTDETKLGQILSNLVANAIKFTRKGKVDFGYYLRENHLEFFVRDTGIGVADDLHEKIFERFRQGNLSSADEFGGNGLGLFISRAYVKLLGGEIWLNSVPGEGSEFYFTIPARKRTTLIDTKTVEPGLHLPEGKTVLIAEDNFANFLLLKKYLSHLNLEIIHAENGQEAFNYCRDNRAIDLVLMDIKMPVMDGFTATRMILDIRPDLPVIALTAYAQTGDREKSLENGCMDYISKPVERNNFISVIGKYLSIEI